MQWWTKSIFTAVNILHIWIWVREVIVCKIQTRDDGWERSLVMSVAVPMSHLVQLQRQISMGRRGEGWSLVMCGPDSSGALSPSLIIYPPSTSLSLDKNGVQGNPVNFPKLFRNFNHEEPQFRGCTAVCR